MSKQVENPKYKSLKQPTGNGSCRPKGCGWVQVDKLIGSDKQYGIVENGIYKVVVYDPLGVIIITPDAPYGENTRELINDQYHWVSFDDVFNPIPEDEELKVGDRVMLNQDYNTYKKGYVMKVKEIRKDGDDLLVQLCNPSTSFWSYSHRIRKF